MKHDNCKGCRLWMASLTCPSYNKHSLCPCTNCLMKMMKCDQTSDVVNDVCDLWTNWFADNHE